MKIYKFELIFINDVENKLISHYQNVNYLINFILTFYPSYTYKKKLVNENLLMDLFNFASTHTTIYLNSKNNETFIKITKIITED